MASVAFAAVNTEYPTSSKSSARFSRTPWSSSTTKMQDPAARVSGARLIIVLPVLMGAGGLYSGQLRRVDKPAALNAAPESRFRDQEGGRLPVREGTDDLPGPLPRFRDHIPAGIGFGEEPIRLQFLEVKGQLGRRVDEVLLQDRGVGDGPSGDDVADDRPPDRIREGFEH